MGTPAKDLETVVQDNKQLSPIDSAIVEFDRYIPEIEKLENKFSDIVYNMTDPKERKQVGSDRVMLAKFRDEIDDLRKTRNG